MLKDQSDDLATLRAALEGLALWRRPSRVTLHSPHLSRSGQRRLERDLTACGCGAGSSTVLAVFIALCVFGLGPFSWGRVAIWIGAIVLAAILGKAVALTFTYFRAKRTLTCLIARHDAEKEPA